LGFSLPSNNDSTTKSIDDIRLFFQKCCHDDRKVVIPVLNIPADQFRLRTETTCFFRKLGINYENLVFTEQINLNTLHSGGKLVITLVDHNALTGSLEKFADCVTSIFDHHILHGERSSK